MSWFLLHNTPTVNAPKLSMVALAIELGNAPMNFQKIMDKILLKLDYVQCYIDDTIIFSVMM